ncbi:right-handed parallel beta-helix repeat-containing protein [Oceanidesulfovibrio marinus]|uniref:Right-handed parallel beta-helix repeat-containing protein n=1 Tax=Oceanidesulfovibrio marinus TaxID=370038 RepID=A0ABX6NBI6_9BACT|nr:right-handed parallel beta-helix repeat-containing protein [Oceanidesulfovibrio marinus]QJT07951.1 right-handed parallel beta-helix repeat-containing protein [Oceanidesulfovibrio marinus]
MKYHTVRTITFLRGHIPSCDRCWLILALVFILLLATPPARAATLEEVLAMTPPDAPGPIARRDMDIGAGRQDMDIIPRKHTVMLQGPSLLDQPDTHYILQNDIVAPATAFRIAASRVTLDLNGHSVVYNESEEGCGVHLEKWWLEDVQVANGFIRQGSNQCAGEVHGMGCNPVFSLSAKKLRLGGLSLTYSGRDVAGIFVRGSLGADIGHCELIDNGREVTNRHQGIDAIRVTAVDDIGLDTVRIHHNVINNARQMGIRVHGKTADINNNEIHINSVVTNSFGVSISDGVIHQNKIFGAGAHPIGIWPGPGVKVHTNYVETQNTAASGEYGSAGSAGLRMTWGKNDGVEAWCNTFLVLGKEDGLPNGMDSWGRALFVGLPDAKQSALFHHNIIAATAQGTDAKTVAVGVVCLNTSPDLVFRENIIASDWCPILLGDDYGHSGGYPLFENNDIIRIGDNSDFHTIKNLYRYRPATGRFLNNRYVDAEQDDIAFPSRAEDVQDVIMEKTITLHLLNPDGSPVRETHVAMTLSNEATTQERATDGHGEVILHVPVQAYTNRNNNGGHFFRPRWVKYTKVPIQIHAGGYVSGAVLNPQRIDDVFTIQMR